MQNPSKAQTCKSTLSIWPERLRIICKGFGGITNIKHFGDLQFEASDSRPHIAAILKIVFATRLKLCWPTKRFDMASNSHGQPAQNCGSITPVVFFQNRPPGECANCSISCAKIQQHMAQPDLSAVHWLNALRHSKHCCTVVSTLLLVQPLTVPGNLCLAHLQWLSTHKPKNQKKTKKNTRPNTLHLTPSPCGVQSWFLFFLIFWFFGFCLPDQFRHSAPKSSPDSLLLRTCFASNSLRRFPMIDDLSFSAAIEATEHLTLRGVDAARAAGYAVPLL